MAVAGGLAVVLTGCVAHPVDHYVPPSSQAPADPTTFPASCPPQQSTALPEKSDVPGAGDSLLPFQPRKAWFCQYNNDEDGALVRSTMTSDSSVLRRLRTSINTTGRKWSYRIVSCPDDTGDHISAYFASATKMIRVYFATGGCADGSNGSRGEYFAYFGSTETQIESILGDPAPGSHT